MANATGARVRAVLTYYRVKYTTRAAQITALKADYLAAFETTEAQGGKTLTNFAADGQTMGWAVGLNRDERLDAMAQALEILENNASGWGQGRIQ